MRDADLEVGSMLEDLFDFHGGLNPREMRFLKEVQGICDKHGQLTTEQSETLDKIYNDRINGKHNV